MDIKKIMIVILLFLVGCQDQMQKKSPKEIINPAVKVVNDFLTERDPLKKKHFLRDNNYILDSLGINEVIHRFPDTFTEIKPSKDTVDDKEQIIEVILGKVYISGKYVNRLQEVFLIRDSSNFKIDLDATLYPRDKSIDSLFKNKIKFNKNIRVFVTRYADFDSTYTINNKKVYMMLLDCITGYGYHVIDINLFNKLDKIVNESNIRHIILKVNCSPENDYNMIVDSLVQVGWIRNK